MLGLQLGDDLTPQPSLELRNPLGRHDVEKRLEPKTPELRGPGLVIPSCAIRRRLDTGPGRRRRNRILIISIAATADEPARLTQGQIGVFLALCLDLDAVFSELPVEIARAARQPTALENFRHLDP